MMDWLRDKLIGWLVTGELDEVERQLRHLQNEITVLQQLVGALQKNELLPQNLALRLTALENSMRAQELKLGAIGALPYPGSAGITIERTAIEELDRKTADDKLRRDRSAAEARGQTLTEYYAWKQQEQARRAARPLQEQVP